MKKYMGMLAAYAAAGILSSDYNARSGYGSANGLPKLIPDVLPEYRPKGHQKFYIGGREIWALNMKNAIKKLNKLNNSKS